MRMLKKMTKKVPGKRCYKDRGTQEEATAPGSEEKSGQKIIQQVGIPGEADVLCWMKARPRPGRILGDPWVLRESDSSTCAQKDS